VYPLPPPAHTTPEAGLQRHPIWRGGPPADTKTGPPGPDHGPHRALRRTKRATDGADLERELHARDPRTSTAERPDWPTTRGKGRHDLGLYLG